MDKDLSNPQIMTSAIRKYKDLIIQYINTENIQNMKNNDLNLFKLHIYDKFNEFKNQYPILLDVLISGQNLDMLDVMLNSLDYLKTSNDFKGDLNKIRYTLGEKLHDTYVKDKIDNKLDINIRKTNKNRDKYIIDKKNKYKK
jgi:hypothetical protein